jgi:hypothetical protein
MGKRTTIVLAAVAAALLAFILVHERHALTSRDMKGRHDRLLPEFVRDHVTRIEIERDGSRIVLVHEREDEDDVLGEWHLAEPVKAAADENNVEALLGSLEWGHPRRTIRDVDADDLARFGLDEPAIRAAFTVKRERVAILVGHEDPTEGGRYVQVGEAPVVHVVGKDFTEALDQEAGHFRRKVLFPDWTAGDAQSLTVRGEEGARALTLRDGRWWLTQPFEAWADHPRVEGALDAALGLKATRYVDEDGVDHGLDRAHLDVRVQGEGADDDAEWTAVLRAGLPCGTHEGEVYTRAGEGPLVCVRSRDLDALRVAAEDLRQATLSSVREPELVFASVVQGGRTLEIEDDDGELRYRAGKAEGDVDGSAVADWLRALHGARVDTFEPLDARHGLSRPRGTVTLKVREEGPETILHLGAATPEGLWVRREGEPFAARVDGAVEEAFDASPVRFRPRNLVTERDDGARRLVIDRDGLTERVERDDDGWRIREPVDTAADKVGTRALIRRLANLEATRFVAERPSASHGLASPRWSVTFRFEGAASQADDESASDAPREYVLRVGAPADGGAYAQLGSDPAVFVLPQVVVDDLASPMVDRDLLATGRNELVAVRIERGAQVVEVTRDGTEWKRADGSAADPERTRRLIDRVGALRATGVTGYGASGAGNDPHARVTVSRSEGAPEPREYTFHIGAPQGDEGGGEGRTPVYVDGLDVGLHFPSDVMDTFVTYEP